MSRSHLFAKGVPRRKGSGRKKGTPNKMTHDMRQAIDLFARELWPDVVKWIRAVAEGEMDDLDKWITQPHPAKAVELYTNLLEFAWPRMQRLDLGSEKDRPIEVRIKQF